MVETLGNDASSYAAVKRWMAELSIRLVRLISLHQTPLDGERSKAVVLLLFAFCLMYFSLHWL